MVCGITKLNRVSHALYRKRVEQLTQALADHEDGRPAAEALRSLIGEVVLTPGDKRGEVHAELRGELFGILELARPDPNDQPDDVMTKGASCPRNYPYRHSRRRHVERRPIR